ncbi:hypothetical protein HMH01_05100 [Halovulum dunhuangense]|uniref:Uncharacterized protein n=1 Tax=Halovulum dunhuangense TaxID=1505036 RepID=A0A849L0N6_9RHOB|nr:hypothetical protein [Halovulum dunhuangense]NNU79815.1 hypothetical protein [Halovulum dunhuangense]
MIRPVLLASIIGLSACAVGPGIPDPSRADSCRAAFMDYDRELRASPRFFEGVLVVGGMDAPSGAFAAESRILQLGCTVFPNRMPDIAALDLSAFAMPAGGVAAPRKMLHLATVTTNTSEAELVRLARRLGYPVTVRGADRLGRRVFLGPLTTDAAQRQALALARALGFDAAYLLTRVP